MRAEIVGFGLCCYLEILTLTSIISISSCFARGSKASFIIEVIFRVVWRKLYAREVSAQRSFFIRTALSLKNLYNIAFANSAVNIWLIFRTVHQNWLLKKQMIRGHYLRLRSLYIWVHLRLVGKKSISNGNNRVAFTLLRTLKVNIQISPVSPPGDWEVFWYFYPTFPQRYPNNPVYNNIDHSQIGPWGLWTPCRVRFSGIAQLVNIQFSEPGVLIFTAPHNQNIFIITLIDTKGIYYFLHKQPFTADMVMNWIPKSAMTLEIRTAHSCIQVTLLWANAGDRWLHISHMIRRELGYEPPRTNLRMWFS